jgi:dTDP-4-amino-4,6-dideoxygalactose transaminase
MTAIDPRLPPKKPDAWKLNQSFRFPFVKPRVPSLDKVAPFFQPAVDAGHYSNFGPVSTALETDLEATLLAGSASVACANCTAGLSAALFALGADGSVLIPAFTFQATASAVIGAGLRSVLGDVDPDTGVLTVEAIDQAVRRQNCNAVMVVRPYGIWSDLSHVADACRQADVPLVIDNAAGIGVSADIVAKYGVEDAIEVISLHATKPFSVGEGGIIKTPRALEQQVRAAINFGFLKGSQGERQGLNGKMSELTAAVARVAHAELGRRIPERQSMAAFYAKGADRAGIEHFADDVSHSPWQCFPVKLPRNVSPDRVVEWSLRSGLQLRRYYQPLFGFDTPAPQAEQLSNRAVCLPVYDGDDVKHAEEIWSIFSAGMDASRTQVGCR